MALSFMLAPTAAQAVPMVYDAGREAPSVQSFDRAHAVREAMNHQATQVTLASRTEPTPAPYTFFARPPAQGAAPPTGWSATASHVGLRAPQTEALRFVLPQTDPGAHDGPTLADWNTARFAQAPLVAGAFATSQRSRPESEAY